jgi:hypothetical protein
MIKIDKGKLEQLQIEQAKRARAAAYAAEADALFFKVQRGEIEMAEWEAKVEEIRNRFPYPDALN